MIGVREYRERAKFRKYVLEQLNPLSSQFERKERAAGEIAARLPQAFDHTQLDRVAAKGKEYGHFLYGCQRAGCRTARHGKVYVTPLQFGYHLPQRLGIAGCVMQFKDNIFSLGITSLTQSIPKALQERVGLGFSGHPKDTIDLGRLLRARCARPRHRTSRKRNEISPSHVNPSDLPSTNRRHQRDGNRNRLSDPWKIFQGTSDLARARVEFRINARELRPPPRISRRRVITPYGAGIARPLLAKQAGGYKSGNFIVSK